MTMSTYKGIFVQRLNDGTIYGVQVLEESGHEVTWKPGDYIERGIEPAIDSLPNQEDYEKKSRG